MKCVKLLEKTNLRREFKARRLFSKVELKDMPESNGLPFIGTMLSLVNSGWAKRLHEYVDDRHRDLGPVYRDKIGPVKAVFVKDPHEYRRIFRLEGSTPNHFLPEAWLLYNQIRSQKRGLLFMNGGEWLHFRRILNNLMLTNDCWKVFIGPCQDAAANLRNHWVPYAEKQEVIPDLEAQLYQWSIEVMLATLIGQKSWKKERSNFLALSATLANTVHKIFEHTSKLSMVPAKMAMKLRLKAWTDFVVSIDSALEVVKVLVSEMMRMDSDGLLKMMMEQEIRDDDLIRIVGDLILAAGDTTAYSMQWALFLLGSHANEQEKLYNHIKNVDDKELLRDPMMKAIIRESLRLYPTAPFLSRFLPEDSVIGGYRIKKGELVLLSLYSSGRDSKNFTRPNEFLPERWLRNEKGEYEGVINAHANIPFAAGARSCIGKKLAETQMTLSLAEIVKTFHMECLNKDRVKLILNLVSVPSEPIQLRLKQRR